MVISSYAHQQFRASLNDKRTVVSESLVHEVWEVPRLQAGQLENSLTCEKIRALESNLVS